MGKITEEVIKHDFNCLSEEGKQNHVDRARLDYDRSESQALASKRNSKTYY